MNNDAKERLKQYLEEDVIYTEYKSGKCDMSDFDKFCIEHCKDIECLLNEVEEYKEVIDKAIEFVQDHIYQFDGDRDFEYLLKILEGGVND